MNILFSFPFERSIVGFLLWLDSILLNIFSIFYKAYLLIAQTKIFQSGAFQSLIDNVYVIFGIVALFIVAWLLLKSMIDPEGDKGTKQVKDIIVRFFAIGIITALIPTIFTFLSDFQNSILAYNVIPNMILGQTSTTLDGYDGDGNYVGSEDVPNEVGLQVSLNSMVNRMSILLIQGIMYPVDENGNQLEDLTVDVSEFWDSTSTKVWGGVIGCVGAGVVGAILVATGVGAAPGIAGAVAICAAGAGVGVSTTNFIAEINAKQYTWQTALSTMQMTGSYDEITLFADAVVDGQMHYSALVSTGCLVFLVYMMVSFCIDLAIRSCKLAFYEVIAPICLLISVIPQKKDLLNNWVKIVLTTYAEIFVRIASICGVTLLISKVDFDSLIQISHPIITAFVLIGLIIFAKQIPKLFSQLTGLDSANMKLGIKDKLKEAKIPVVSDAVGTGAKKLAAGIDAKAHGRRFSEGANKVEGYVAKTKKKIGNYLPYTEKSWESKKAYEETQDTLEIARSNYRKYGNADDFIEEKGDREIKKALHDKKNAKSEWAKAQADLKALVASGTATSEEIQAAEKVLADATNKKDLTDKEFKDLLGTKARLNEVYKSLKYYEDSGRMSLDNADQNINVEKLKETFKDPKAVEPFTKALDNLKLSDEALEMLKKAIIESLDVDAKKRENGEYYTSQDTVLKNINDVLGKQLGADLKVYQQEYENELRRKGVAEKEISALVEDHMSSLEKSIETSVRKTVTELKVFDETKGKQIFSRGYRANRNKN